MFTDSMAIGWQDGRLIDAFDQGGCHTASNNIARVWRGRQIME